MIFLEIQRGKEAMNGSKFGQYSDVLGVTAAFVKRCIEATHHSGLRLAERHQALQLNTPEYFTGDSWFSSVTAALAAQELGHEYFGPVKTNTKGFPKDEIIDIMKDWPSGSSIVLECKEEKLFAVGYKYSLRSKGALLAFVLSTTQTILTALVAISFDVYWYFQCRVNASWRTLYCEVS